MRGRLHTSKYILYLILWQALLEQNILANPNSNPNPNPKPKPNPNQALLEQNILARREEKEREIEAEHAGAVVGLMRAAGLA